MAWKCLGFGVESDLSTAKGLPIPSGMSAIPSGVDMCVILPEGGNVRFRADGTDPTNDIGQLAYDGAPFPFSGPYSAIKFIEDTVSDTPKISVHYYSFG